MSLTKLLLEFKDREFTRSKFVVPTVEIRNIHDLNSLETLCEDWACLLQQSPNQDAFLTCEWLLSWLKHHSINLGLWLVTAWINDELVGICPLVLKEEKKHGFKLRVLHSLGAPHADVGGFIVKNNSLDVYKAICKYLVSQKRQWDLLELDEIDIVRGKTGPLTSIFNELGCTILETRNRHFYLDTSSDWNSYFRQLPSKTRHEFRRKAKHVELTACTSFIHHSGTEVTCDDINTMFSINEHAHFPAFFESAEEKNFHRELLHQMSARQSMDIAFLYMDDEPVAFSYGFIHNDRLEVWRIGFNKIYSNLSIGIVMMNKLLEDCFTGHFREVDLLRGEEPYKEQWQPQHRTYAKLRVGPPGKLIPNIVAIWIPKLLHTIKKK